MTLSFVIPEFNIGGAGTPPLQFFRRGFLLNGTAGSGPSWQDIILSGNGSLSLTNAKANGLNYLKLFGGTEQRNLPVGHTQLEYVYMTSGSYIKIEDLLISSEYRIEFDFQTTSLASDLRNYLGGRAGGVSAGGGFRLSKLGVNSTYNNNVVLYGFEAGTEYYAPEQFQANTRYKYTYNNGVCTLESGGNVVSTRTFTVTDNTNTKWGINAYVNGDSWQTNSLGIYTYSLKVWNPQGELVMDLVPDLTSSNVVCLYDMVTGNIREASAGTFEAGTIAPTPIAPVNIISNNGAIKYSANMCNVNEQTALIGYYISSSGVVTADANNWIYQDYIPVEPSTTYTLTMSTPVYYVTISEYSTTDDSGFIRRNAGSTGGNTSLTITTRSNTKFIRFGANLDGSTNVTLDGVLAINWMLNKGNSLPYAPYSEDGIYTDGTVETIEVDTTGDTATAEMLLSVGDYQDEQNVTNGHITRNVGIKVLTGAVDEEWGTSVSTKFYWDTDFAIPLNNSPILCTCYQQVLTDRTAGVGDNQIALFLNLGKGRIVICDPRFTTIEHFRQYLADQYNSGTPVIVVYPLAEPITESVSHQHLGIQAGSNTVEITQASIDNLELEVSYKGKEGE